MPNSDQEGRSAIDVVAELLTINADISELCLFEPPPLDPARIRLGDSLVLNSIVEAGLKIRREIGLPFWDSVLISSLEAGAGAFPILEQALFHNAPAMRVASIARAHWSRSEVAQIANKGTASSVLVLRSRIHTKSGGYRHIPMLDFHCPNSQLNRQLAARISVMVDPKGGFLLDSGNSFHFYGKSLLSEAELSSFLGRALLFSPIVDRAWIGHQLVEGSCGLRVTSKSDGTREPFLVQEIDARVRAAPPSS
jgi:hypothetical protein